MLYRTTAVAVVLAAMLTAPSVSRAQDRGTWDLTLLTDPSDGTINPIVGYFVVDNAELAFSGSYSSFSFGGDFDGDIKTLALELDILYNAYLNENLAFVPIAGFGILNSSAKYNLSSDTKDDELYFILGGGLRFFLSERGALALFVDYQNGKLKSKIEGSTYDGDVTGIAVRFGYSLFFP